jgi:hypothetical protein
VLGGVVEADRAEDAVAGLDQAIAVEAGELGQARHQGLIDLLDELAGALLIDRVIATNGGKHWGSNSLLWGGGLG